MAVESQGFRGRSGYSTAFPSGGHRSWWSAFLYQMTAAAREASPWLLSATIVTTPFVVYAVGQAKLGSAMNRRTALLRQIRDDRVEITQLRDELRTAIAPSVMMKWAERYGMQPARDVVAVGLRPDPGLSRADSDRAGAQGRGTAVGLHVGGRRTSP